MIFQFDQTQRMSSIENPEEEVKEPKLGIRDRIQALQALEKLLITAMKHKGKLIWRLC